MAGIGEFEQKGKARATIWTRILSPEHPEDALVLSFLPSRADVPDCLAN
jgi:hypothetical protein